MGHQQFRPWISVIIPNYNGAAFLRRCLESLAKQSYREFEVIIVDNASTDGSVELARTAAPEAKVLVQAQNLGFAAAVNEGAQASSGTILAVLNNDTEVAPDWLEECIAAFERHPEAAFLACRILDLAHRDILYSAGDCFLRGGIGYRRGQGQEDRSEYHVDCPIFSACGCAAIYRKERFQEAGGFDARFFAYLEDVDLGLRLQAAGHRGFYAAAAEVYHQGGGTSGGEFSPLAVHLRTRNAFYLLLKNLPARFLLRCAPMVFLSQLFWLCRALARGRLLNYIAGGLELLRWMPEVRRIRGQIRARGANLSDETWRIICRSEDLAREDYLQPASVKHSVFLNWYFRLFSGSLRN